MIKSESDNVAYTYSNAFKGIHNPLKELISHAKTFTEFHKSTTGCEKSEREFQALSIQIPVLFDMPKKGDVFFGRISKAPLVGIAPEAAGFARTNYGYYLNDFYLKLLRSSVEFDAQDEQDIKDLENYWEENCTAVKARNSFPEEVKTLLPSDRFHSDSVPAFPLYRICGIQIDNDKLLHLGIGGLRKEIEEHLEDASLSLESKAFLNSSIKTLDFMGAYLREIAVRLKNIGEEEFAEMAEILDAISFDAPRTLREAMQLMIFYNMSSGIFNYGRMDVYFGDFLEMDYQAGRLDEKSATDLTVALWRIILCYEKAFFTRQQHRIFIGGKGRRNELNADKFALIAMSAQDIVHEYVPNLTLRRYKGQNPALEKKAYEIISNYNPFPMLYNDDVNIPAFAKAMRVEEKHAVDYTPYGCGEYCVQSYSVAPANSVINLASILDITIFNGKNIYNGQQQGLELGYLNDFKTFEDFKNAYEKNMTRYVDALTTALECTDTAFSKDCSLLLSSVLFDGCIEKGKPMLDGGISHLSAATESYGNITTADSLEAVRVAVFEKKLVSPALLMKAIQANFEGYEDVRAILKSVPKFGNDNENADKMAQWVHDSVSNAVRDSSKIKISDSSLVVVINNQTNVVYGVTTPATPDGRKCGEALSNGNTPSAGNDKSGITAMLNSIVKLDPSIMAGAVHNLKVSKDLMTANLDKLSILIDTYWEKGGTQLMLTVVDKGILEDARKNPEKHPNLLVRVGGFSARFVTLPKEVQEHIIARTLYE